MWKSILKMTSAVLLVLFSLLIGKIYFTDTMYSLWEEMNLQTEKRYGVLHTGYYDSALPGIVWSSQGNDYEMYLITESGMTYFNLPENSLYLFYDLDRIISLNSFMTAEYIAKRMKKEIEGESKLASLQLHIITDVDKLPIHMKEKYWANTVEGEEKYHGPFFKEFDKLHIPGLYDRGRFTLYVNGQPKTFADENSGEEIFPLTKASKEMLDSKKVLWKRDNVEVVKINGSRYVYDGHTQELLDHIYVVGEANYRGLSFVWAGGSWPAKEDEDLRMTYAIGQNAMY